MNQLGLGINLTTHITCYFCWKHHFDVAENSVPSEETQTMEVGRSVLPCCIASWKLGMGVGEHGLGGVCVEGGGDGRHAGRVDLAELEKHLGFLTWYVSFAHLGLTETYSLQRGLLVTFNVTIHS